MHVDGTQSGAARMCRFTHSELDANASETEDRRVGEQPASDPFLSSLSDDEARAVRARGVVRQFQRGSALFYEQQPPGRVLILLEGRVKLTRTTDEGREVVLAVRGPGDLLGELSAIDDEPRSATAVALEPVEAIALAPADFRAFVESTPGAARAIVRMLTARLREADAKLVAFTAQDSLGRVAARLVDLSTRFGRAGADGEITIDLPISQEELAGWTGSSREAVAKALQSLRALGCIRTERRSITITDVEQLNRQAR